MTTMTTALLACATTTALLAGCPDREVAAVAPQGSAQDATQIPVNQNRDVDILFVIDNSNSMGDEQALLTRDFHKFMTRLSAIDGGLPNVHIGVISSNVGAGGFGWTGCAGNGDDGLLQSTARGACAPPTGPFRFIEDIALDGGGRQKNYSGTLEETFECIAALGTGGCGFEQHLESMKRALDGSHPENDGFLRPGAFLAVVFIADEDDCSAHDSAIFDDRSSTDDVGSALGGRSLRCTEWGVTCDGGTIARGPGEYASCEPRRDSPYIQDPAYYAEFLRGLKPQDPGLVLIAGLFGPPEPFRIGDGAVGLHLLPSCGSDSTEAGDGAVPPIRFRALFEEFGDKATMESICGTDLSTALENIAERFRAEFDNTCLADAVDLSDLFPARPGLQPECSVTQVEPDGEMTVIGRCTMLESGSLGVPDPAGHRPCWLVGEDLAKCNPLNEDGSASGDSGFTLEVVRDVVAPSGSELLVSCVGI